MPHTLLLADDSVTIQRVIELTFAGEDVQVVAVGDGEQAIAQMEASPPDIVLADIGMPGKNGYEVAQYVKDSPRLAHIPVVLLTGVFEPVDQARATAAGCEGVLAKPFEPHLVIGRVKELLAKGTRPAAAAAPNAAVPPVAPRPSSSVDAWLPAPLAAGPTRTAKELDNYFDELDVALANLGTPESRSGPEPTFAPAPEESATPPAAPALAQADHDWFGALTAIDEPGAADRWGVAPPQPIQGEPDLSLSYGSPAADFAGPGDQTLSKPSEDFDRGVDASASGSLAVAWPLADDAAEHAPSTWEASPVSQPQPVVDPPASAAPLASTEQRAESASAPVDAEAQPETAQASIDAARVPAGELPSLADAFAAFLASEGHAHAPNLAALWPASPPVAPVLDEDAIEAIAQRVLARLSDRVVRETVADLVSAVAERLVREEIERIKAAIT